jgi:hypothetical protein
MISYFSRSFKFMIKFRLTHPANLPCGRKLEYPEETHDFRQSWQTLFTWVRNENRTHDLRGETPCSDVRAIKARILLALFKQRNSNKN